jgi:galactokinase
MGYVMTMTIDRDTWISARPRTDRQVNLFSLNLPGESHFSLDDIQHDTVAPWGNYVRGVAHFMQVEGHQLNGFDGLIHSTVPFGSGLSSSAALEMATAVLFARVSGFTPDPVAIALIGQRAENEFVGVNTGILDQYSSALGQEGCALQLDCRHLSSEPVRIADDIAIVICNTNAKRNLVGSEYDDRRARCEEGVRILRQHNPSVAALRDVSLAQFERVEAEMPPLVAKRCRFIIEENQRVLDLATVLPTGDHQALNTLYSKSWRGARDLFEIGSPAMQAMIDAMEAGPGVVAARQTGAGFGGCMVALVEAGCVAQFSDHVHEAYQEKTGIEPDIYPVSASAGAGIVY